MIVHRYWDGEPSKLNDWTRVALMSLGHEVRDWDNESLPSEVLMLAGASSVNLPATEHVRHVSNVVRWWALHVFGGWWADYDLIPLRSFNTLPFPVTANHHSTRCTSFLGFPPDHPVPGMALERIAAHTGRVRSSGLLSGEGMLNDICTDDVAKLELPIDANGTVRTDDPWAVHLFSHGRR